MRSLQWQLRNLGNHPINLKHLNIKLVPRSKHSFSVIKTKQIVLYTEATAACSDTHTKHVHILCKQNVNILIFYLIY
jgi:hypothetical protein